MKKTLLYTCLCLLVYPFCYYAGGPAVSWNYRYGYTNDDWLRYVAQNTDGTYLIGGFSQSPSGGDISGFNRGGYDYWIIKVDATGTKIWDKRYGGGADDKLRALAATSDGGYILGGYSNSNGSAMSPGEKKQPRVGPAGTTDYWVIKINAIGDTLWTRTFGGTRNDNLEVIKQTSDGGYLLQGWSNSDVSGSKSDNNRDPMGWLTGSYDLWIVKFRCIRQ